MQTNRLMPNSVLIYKNNLKKKVLLPLIEMLIMTNIVQRSINNKSNNVEVEFSSFNDITEQTGNIRRFN